MLGRTLINMNAYPRSAYEKEKVDTKKPLGHV